jgi:hypothetical protein
VDKGVKIPGRFDPGFFKKEGGKKGEDCPNKFPRLIFNKTEPITLFFFF